MNYLKKRIDCGYFLLFFFISIYHYHDHVTLKTKINLTTTFILKYDKIYALERAKEI